MHKVLKIHLLKLMVGASVLCSSASLNSHIRNYNISISFPCFKQKLSFFFSVMIKIKILQNFYLIMIFSGFVEDVHYLLYNSNNYKNKKGFVKKARKSDFDC